jgi:hypothetical protein
MGWRFRKVFQQGPFRTTISKGGVGWSIGISGFRYGIGSNGHRHISAGIPGTGLYWYKDLDLMTGLPNASSQFGGQLQPPQIPSKAPVDPKTIEPWWKQKGIKE